MTEKRELIKGENLGVMLGGGRWLFRALNFSVSAGELLLVEGPNGSGKSTLLNVLRGRARPTEGAVDWRTRSVVSIPQLIAPTFALPITLGEVLSSRTKSAAKAQGSLLAESDTDRLWNTASGGERQRALLTLALGQRPDVLLLDEPLNHLDSASQRILTEHLVGFLKASGAIILVSHGHLRALGEWPGRGVIRMGEGQ